MTTTPETAETPEHDVEGFASDFFKGGIIAVTQGDLLPAVQVEGIPLIRAGIAGSGWDVKGRKAGG